MFDLRRPCKDCPFRKGMGERFRLPTTRLNEIFSSQAFQCHKTLGEESDEGEPTPGAKPQQCAGVMSLLHRAGRPNDIMRIARLFEKFDPDKLIHTDVYGSIADVYNAHAGRKIVMTNIQSKKTHCPQGHPYADDNLILMVVRDKDGNDTGKRKRQCKTCKRASSKKSKS